MDSMIYGGLTGLVLSALIIFSIMGGWGWLSRKLKRKPQPDHVLVNVRPSDTIEIDGVEFEIDRWESSYIQLCGRKQSKAITVKSSAQDIERSIVNHHELYGFFVGARVEINDRLYKVDSYETAYFDGKRPRIMLYPWGQRSFSYYSYI